MVHFAHWTEPDGVYVEGGSPPKRNTDVHHDTSCSSAKSISMVQDSSSSASLVLNTTNERTRASVTQHFPNCATCWQFVRCLVFQDGQPCSIFSSRDRLSCAWRYRHRSKKVHTNCLQENSQNRETFPCSESCLYALTISSRGSQSFRVYPRSLCIQFLPPFTRDDSTANFIVSSNEAQSFELL